MPYKEDDCEHMYERNCKSSTVGVPTVVNAIIKVDHFSPFRY